MLKFDHIGDGDVAIAKSGDVRRFIMLSRFPVTGGRRTARFVNAGVLLILFGVAILVASIAVLLISVPRIGFGFPAPADLQLIVAQVELSWFFIFFASIMIFMGVRRAIPIPV